VLFHTRNKVHSQREFRRVISEDNLLALKRMVEDDPFLIHPGPGRYNFDRLALGTLPRRYRASQSALPHP
jgi:hypothetical protein